jgi:uncharacterized protein (DUF1810 family)
VSDIHGLARFVAAQDAYGMFDRALAEIRAGRKVGHWMWFVFPQIAGLGFSETSRFYAIAGLDEARAYLAHPVLGPRLRECTAAVATSGRSAGEIFGDVDAVKLRSSATLFRRADPHEAVFTQVLDAFFDGVADPDTESRL